MNPSLKPFPRPGGAASLLLSAMLLCAAAQAQTAPEYVYQATRYMPNGETQSFDTLAEAEAFIRTEPATPRGNAFLEKNTTTNSGYYTLHDYRVPRRKYETYTGDFYNGHMSGNATDCSFTMCDTEEQAVAASMRAYPLEGSYTPELFGEYLTPPHKMWSTTGRSAYVIMNAVQYSGASIPNERYIVATNSVGHSYRYRLNRVDYYECPELFHAVDNAFGEPLRGTWPLICLNTAMGQIVQLTRQRAPNCDIKTSNGNPCASDTGNKQYVEDDFSWDGLVFRRSYNSVAEFALQSGLGDNWAHAFSDRLTFDTSGNPHYWIRADGYVEALTAVGSSGMYRPTISSGTTLRKETDAAVIAAAGAWELSLPNGARFWFNNAGRLQRSERGALRLSFEYCSSEAAEREQCLSGQLLRVTSASGRSLAFEYSALPAPVGWRLSPPVRLTRVLSAGSVLVQYSYDSELRLVAVHHGGPGAPGRQYRYAETDLVCRDAQQNAIPGCNPVHFSSHLTGVIGEDGNRLTYYSYDAKGRVLSSEAAGGNGRVVQDYVSPASVRVHLPGGALKTYTFNTDTFKRAVQSSVVDTVTGQTEIIAAGYSGDRISHYIAPDGRRTNFSYDGLRETVRVEGLTASGATTADTRTVQTDWDALANQPAERRVRDAAGNLAGLWRWTYNSRGQILSHSRVDPTPQPPSGPGGPAAPADRTTHYSYCEQAGIDAGSCPLPGLITTVDGPAPGSGDATRYSYYLADDPGCVSAPAACGYRKGDLWKIINALGHVVEYRAYDAAGRILSLRDANGITTDYEYDARGRLAAAKRRGDDPAVETDDSITRYAYTAEGEVARVTGADGAYVDYRYDAALRLVGLHDNLGNAVEYTLDSAGNRIREDIRDAAGVLRHTLSQTYDQLGRIRASARGTRPQDAYSYDAAGGLDLHTSETGVVTDRDYDALGRLSRSLADSAGIRAETRHRFDALDNRVEIIDPKQLSTRYRYDGLGDLVQVHSPDSGISDLAYDSAGNRSSITSANGVTATFSHDALRRLQTIAYPDSSLGVTFSYDEEAAGICGENAFRGRLGLSTDSSGGTRYCYHRNGRVARKIQTTNSKVFEVRYEYDIADRLKRLVYPSGLRVDYTRNSRGDISTVQVTRPGQAAEVLLSSVSYYPFGPVAQLTFGNGRSLTRTLNQEYRVSAIHTPGAAGLSLGYVHDDAGNIRELREGSMGGALLRRYSYDSLNRLVEVRDGTGAVLHSYAYDATGNRSAASGSSYVYTAQSHRLESAGGQARSYDANGNTLTIGSDLQLEYNQANRLSRAQRGSASVRYAYNARGEQVRRYDDSASGYAVHDEEGLWLGAYADNGSSVQEIIWLDGMPVGVVAAGQLHYVLTDHLRTPRAVIAAQPEKIVWRWSLLGEPFGADTPEQDPDGDGQPFVFDLRFAGQRHDALTGLSYNYYRDYEPAAGRYVQSDPLGQRGGLATYDYVGGDPLRHIDARGLARDVLDATVCPECRNPAKVSAGKNSWCTRMQSDIEDVGLRACVGQRCDSTVVECTHRCESTCEKEADGSPARAYGYSQPSQPAYITLCQEVRSENGWGATIVHEFAHTCGWKHCDGGGVPNDRSRVVCEETRRQQQATGAYKDPSGSCPMRDLTPSGARAADRSRG